MSEPTITIPLALAQRLSDLLGGKWTYDSYGDCRYCGDPLSSEHRCELAQIERELDDLLSRAQPAPGTTHPSAEPVAYAAFSDNGNIRIWCADPIQAETLRGQYGHDLQPLYAQPPAQDEAVRRDEFAQPSERDELYAALSSCEEEGQRMQMLLTRIVAEADSNPFNPIGHVIEHVVPEARAIAAQQQEVRND